jgi:hypothetical protein
MDNFSLKIQKKDYTQHAIIIPKIYKSIKTYLLIHQYHIKAHKLVSLVVNYNTPCL